MKRNINCMMFENFADFIGGIKEREQSPNERSSKAIVENSSSREGSQFYHGLSSSLLHPFCLRMGEGEITVKEGDVEQCPGIAYLIKGKGRWILVARERT